MGQVLKFCGACENKRGCSDCIDLHNWIVERLEPEWTSVEKQQPAPFISVQVHLALEDDESALFPRVREGYIVGDGIFFIPSLGEKRRGTHWRPMSDPPEVEDAEKES